MNYLKQRKGFETRVYTLDPETEFIEVENKTIQKKLRYKIHISEVGNEILYHSENMITKQIFYIISALIAIICFVFYFIGDVGDRGAYRFNAVAWGILAGSGLMISPKDDLVITNGNRVITLFRTKPNEKEVLEFADMLIGKANVKKKELLINFELGEEQFLTNIHWLHSMRMIDKTELAQLQADFNLKKIM
ncbi:MAG: hypothetical protein ACQEWG_15310 [Bacteroidota bacterium]